MLNYTDSRLTLTVDPTAAAVTSLCLDGVERLVAPSPLFCVRLRDADGNAIVLHAKDAQRCEQRTDGLRYSDFSMPAAHSVAVDVRFTAEDGEMAVWVSVTPGADALAPLWAKILIDLL